jgi:hypothetical protein
MAKVSPNPEGRWRPRTYYDDLHPKNGLNKLNVAELHVDMGRLVSMYFLHNVEATVTYLTIFVAVCIGLILLIIWILNVVDKGDAKIKDATWSTTLFWGTFFLMILSLCGNFVSDRKDKSIMPYVTDYVNKFYPQKESRPTPMNVLMNGHAWETLWNGLAPKDEKYFIDLTGYDHRRKSTMAQQEKFEIDQPLAEAHDLPRTAQTAQTAQTSQDSQVLPTPRISQASRT